MKRIKIFTGQRKIYVDIPEHQLIFNAVPVKIPCETTEEQIIVESLENPIGTPRLEEMLKKKDKVVIMVDDITRPTPQYKILPHLLNKIERQGISRSQIKIVIALGTHRCMSKEEICSKIGNDIYKKYKIVNIDYKDRDKFVQLEVEGVDIPIEVYREVIEADFKIAVGNIVPHVVVGWSGGAKMIQPGVCGEKTTTYTHWKGAVENKVMDVCGNVDIPIRKEVEDIAGKIGLDFIVNVVMDEDKNILGVFSGHYVKAHREGVKLAERVWRPEIPQKADILIASAYPCYLDYWQAFKPFAFAQFGVKEGGTIIFLFDAPEKLCGNSPAHAPTLEKWFGTSAEQIVDGVKKGLIDDVIAATNPLNHFEIVSRCKVICVSQNLCAEDIKLLQFEYASNISEALKRAYQYEGSDAKVGVIPFCGETLVKLKNNGQ